MSIAARGFAMSPKSSKKLPNATYMGRTTVLGQKLTRVLLDSGKLLLLRDDVEREFQLTRVLTDPLFRPHFPQNLEAYTRPISFTVDGDPNKTMLGVRAELLDELGDLFLNMAQAEVFDSDTLMMNEVPGLAQLEMRAKRQISKKGKTRR